MTTELVSANSTIQQHVHLNQMIKILHAYAKKYVNSSFLLTTTGAKRHFMLKYCINVHLLLLVCVPFTIIGQPRNSVLIRRV